MIDDLVYGVLGFHFVLKLGVGVAEGWVSLFEDQVLVISQ